MSFLANNCDGTSGAAVPASAAGGPDAFDTTQVTGSGATLTYDSAQAHSGPASMKSHLPAGAAATARQDWAASLPGSPTANAYMRLYVYMTALPTANTRLAAFLGSGALRTALQLQTNGLLRTLNSAGGTVSQMTESFPLGQWVRVEFEITGISGTNGTVAARIFSGSGLETTVPDTGGSVSGSSSSIGGTVDDVRLGMSSSVTMVSAWDCWFDDAGYSDAATPGPLVPSLLVVVVADMQPGAGVNAPPSVVAAQIAALNPAPDYVIIPGDLANDGTAAQYGFFDMMYGSLMSRIYPVPGNHDWVPGSLANYDGDSQLAARVHAPAHYYSFDTSNGWHVIGLESDAQQVAAPVAGTDQYRWLAADLAANTGKHIIAFWHHPRWSDGTNVTDPGGTADSVVMQDVWNLLRDYNCDLVLTGHCHSYQRFPKLGKTGAADANGIREIVAGTGGSGLFTLTGSGRAEVNSYQAAAYDQLNSKWFGYLRLFLSADTYSWQFVSQNAAGSEAPGQILDSGGPVAANTPVTASIGLLTASVSSGINTTTTAG